MFASFLRTTTLRNCQKWHWLVQRKCLASEAKPSNRLYVSPERVQDYRATLPEVIQILTEDEQDKEMMGLNSYFSDLMQYLFSKTNASRAQLTMVAYETLEQPGKITPEKLKLSLFLGRICEVIQEAYLMMDDVTDKSETRRNQPCWHTKEKVGLNAVNDGILLELFMYKIMKKHFSQFSWYRSAWNMMHKSLRTAAIGQCMDCFISLNQGYKLEDFTLEKVITIIYYKSGPLFHIPIRLGMLLANKHDPDLHKRMELVGVKIGTYFQIKDDYLDCFGTAKDLGTDIQDGKCTWMVAKALELANPKQKERLAKCYGSYDPEAYQGTLDLFRELNLEEAYEETKKDYLKDIKNDILMMAHDEQLLSLMLKIFKVHS